MAKLKLLRVFRRMIQKSFFWISYVYIANKLKYRKHLTFDYSVKIGKGSSFEGMNRLHANSSFSGQMGYGSYIGNYSELQGKIGRYCSIGRYVKTNLGIHPYTYPHVSTSPAFYSVAKQNGGTFTNTQRYIEFKYADNENKFSVIIGNDCWIGENVFLVGGVTINDGAVILAGAVVTKDIPAYAIAGGIPAKIVRYRYDEESIIFLRQFQWWNRSPQWLKENIEAMNDINKLKRYKE